MFRYLLTTDCLLASPDIQINIGGGVILSSKTLAYAGWSGHLTQHHKHHNVYKMVLRVPNSKSSLSVVLDFRGNTCGVPDRHIGEHILSSLSSYLVEGQVTSKQKIQTPSTFTDSQLIDEMARRARMYNRKFKKKQSKSCSKTDNVIDLTPYINQWRTDHAQINKTDQRYS